jgi:hypothetical protein
LQNYFRQSFESWVAGLRPVCFLVLFAQCKKNKPVSLSGTSEVLQTSIQRTAAVASYQPIKTFFRKLRGFANLDSAHRSDIFAPQQLKPFPKGASRFCKPQISAPQWQLRTNQLKPLRNFSILFVRHKKDAKKAFATCPKSESFKAHIPPDRIPDSDTGHAPVPCLRQANDREAIKSASDRLLSAFLTPQAHMFLP